MSGATMLYRCPGPHVTDGIAYDYTVVDAADVDAALADGWHRHYDQAHAAMQAASADAAAQLQANEARLAEVDAALAKSLQARHKGRGVWAVVDADGNEVQTGLTKEEAQAAVGA